MQTTYRSEQDRLEKKYDDLKGGNRRRLNCDAVKNLSSKILTENEYGVLEKGLNFNTDHTKKDVLTLISTTENEIANNSSIDRLDRP